MSFSSTDPSPDPPEPEPIGTGLATPEGNQPTTGGVSSLRCEVCGAVVAADQRYCVECGNHRVGVNDPAASFMNRSGARGAQRAGRAVVVSSRRSRLQTALMLVLIPIAIAVGVLIGRSSNNGDGRLERALLREKAQVVQVKPATAKIVTVSSGAAASTKSTKTKSKSTTAASTTTHKAAGSIGAKSSASQAKQSAKIVKKLQSTNGLSYLNPLPSQVGG